jgi:hypothetical protein
VIVVLSAYRPRLEDFLTARGEKIVAVIPESMREPRESTNPRYPIRTIDHFDDYTELARIAAELEALGVTAVATIDEPCVRAAAFVNELLGLPGLDHRSAVACTDTSVMKRRLAAAGVPVAEHRVAHDVRQIRKFLDDAGGEIVVYRVMALEPSTRIGSTGTILIGWPLPAPSVRRRTFRTGSDRHPWHPTSARSAAWSSA